MYVCESNNMLPRYINQQLQSYRKIGNTVVKPEDFTSTHFKT